MGKRTASAGLRNNGQMSKRKRSITPEDAPYATQSDAYNLGGAADKDTPASSDGEGDGEGEGCLVVVPAPPRSAYKIPAYTHENRTMRLYAGPLRKWDRRQALINTVYGPRKSHIELFLELQQRFSRCTYPVAYRPLLTDTDTQVDPRGEVLVSPWLPNNLELDQQKAYSSWSKNYAQAMRAAGRVPFGEIEDVSEKDAQPFLPWVVNPDANLIVFVNTEGGENIKPGAPSHRKKNLAVSPARFNAGGNILSLAWAPMSSRHIKDSALLAVAVVPHGKDGSNDSTDSTDRNDNDDSKNTAGATKQEKARLVERMGSIQFWRVALEENGNGPSSTANGPTALHDGAHLDSVCCFYWGWPKQLEWCPIQPHNSEAWPGLLAVRTEEGIVRIIKPQRGGKEKPKYGRVVRPMATLNFPGEDDVHATCMSWVGINRLVVGYTDGTIALWSLFPQLVLLRIQTHASPLQDICTGYPSKPYMVTIRPVEGVLRLIDLTRPSSEHTFHSSPVAGIQGNMLDWVEHMQGFAAPAPTNSPVNHKLDFLHHRHFPCPRRFFPSRRESPPTCLAVGKVHPFALVGGADGSLWGCNVLDTVFPTHWESHVPFSTWLMYSESRNISRIKPDNPMFKCRAAVVYQSMFRQETDNTKADAVDDDAMDMDDVSGLGPSSSAQELPLGQYGTVTHEKASAVTAVAWNPDLEFGTIYAVGLASGLVLVRKFGKLDEPKGP